MAVTTYDRGAAAAWSLGVLAVLLVLGAGCARRPSGIAVGWVLQVARAGLAGLLVPAMFAARPRSSSASGSSALVYGGKADRAAAQNRAAAAAAEAERSPPRAAAEEPPASR